MVGSTTGNQAVRHPNVVGNSTADGRRIRTGRIGYPTCDSGGTTNSPRASPTVHCNHATGEDDARNGCRQTRPQCGALDAGATTCVQLVYSVVVCAWHRRRIEQLLARCPTHRQRKTIPCGNSAWIEPHKLLVSLVLEYDYAMSASMPLQTIK